MKFLVDAQLPPALCEWLGERGGLAEHVTNVLSGEVADSEIAALAVATGRIIVTKDDDFAGRHKHADLRILWLRIGNASNRRLQDWLAVRWDEIAAAIDAGESVIEVR